jgi:hypothetical protein
MNQLQKIPIKLVIVQSQGGARGDFLAGWLGSLPDFVDSQWYIDCETGQSFTHAKFFKEYQNHFNLDDFLAGYNFARSDRSTFQLAATTHFCDLSNVPAANVKIISIRVSESDMVEVQWNRLVKTFLTQHRYESAMWKNIRYGIDLQIEDRSNIDNDARFRLLENRKQSLFDNIPRPICQTADYVFDYKEIFTPMGSHLIADRLKLQCVNRHHLLWQKNLEFAAPPDIIDRFGQTYTFDDFKHMFQNQTCHRP